MQTKHWSNIMRPYILTGMIAGALILAASIITATPSTSTAQSYEQFKPGQTMITLSATEQMELKQDLLVGSLRIEQDAKTAKEVQDKINQLMKQAVELAKKESTVKVSTGQYNVYSFDPNPQPQPVYNAEEIKNRSIWRGQQTIDIQSKDQEKLLALVGEIQNLGFAMNSLNYVMTPDQMEEYKDALMTAALEKINGRAMKAARALGKRKFDIVEVNIDGAPQMPPPVMYARAEKMMVAGAADAMAAPVAEASTQNISLTVTARVMLRD
jgi:predicted secreted protein